MLCDVSQFGRRLELRRSKLKRAAVSRNNGIIDRIRHQLAVPGTLNQFAQIWQKPPRTSEATSKSQKTSVHTSGGPGDENRSEPGRTHQQPSPAPPSYASVVKKAMEAKDMPQIDEIKDSIRTENPAEAKNSHCAKCDSPQLTNPCRILVHESTVSSNSTFASKPCPDFEFSLVTETRDESAGKEDTTVCRISNNFPKEYTNYNSDEMIKPSSSKLQIVPLNDRILTQGGSNTPNLDLSNLSWPRPMFPTPSRDTSDKQPDCRGAMGHQPSQKYQTPSLHIRPTAKSQPKTQAGSPPRKPKQKPQTNAKEKASAPGETAAQREEVEEQRALLDMALTSCLADNAQLRTTVVSLEKQLATLKAENQAMGTQIKIDAEKQEQSPCELKQIGPQRARSFKTPKLLEQRKVPICKWAGKMTHLVRSNVEIISLSAKVKGYKQDVASLTSQVNALKETLQLETKRSRRALSKWFKAKIKVKVLRSRLRELQLVERVPSMEDTSRSSPVSGTEKPAHALCSGETIREEPFEPEEHERADEWEPPCKRAKLDIHVDLKSTNSREEINVPEPQEKHPPLLPPPPSSQQQAQNRTHQPSAQADPMGAPHVLQYASPPIGPFFNFFTVNTGENDKSSLEPNATLQQNNPLQQAVVAPLYHNNLDGQFIQSYTHPMQQQQQQHFQHVSNCAKTKLAPPNQQQMPTPQNLLSRDVPAPTSCQQIGQRKKSPPHLPLPTPPRSPVSPPSYHTLPHQQVNQWRRANLAQRTPVLQSPPFTRSCNNTGMLHPPSPNAPCQIPGWYLPQMNHQVEGHILHGRVNDSSLLSPWSLSPPVATWDVNGFDRNSSFCTSLFANPGNQDPQWPQNTVINHLDSYVNQANHTENNFYSQKESFLRSQNMSGIVNTPVPYEAYYREEPSQAGPCRKPLSCVQPRAPPAGRGRQTQAPSPPGKYRSDFMRRLMKGDAWQDQRQPNPYRLFNQGGHTEPNRQNNFDQGSLGLYPLLPCTVQNLEEQSSFAAPAQSLASPRTAVLKPTLASPQLFPVNRAEASYRNTATFVELTTDGLLENPSLDMATAPLYMDGGYGSMTKNGNNNSWNCFEISSTNNTVLSKLRPIESLSAFELVDL
ncbi:hypothetical protein ElyMa_004933300 [Elysia marginata]|uniref:Uncharacterized protein n=1 Tax=Elysia marginata TaxID=1093978 RepID=A0AAV4J2E4_9GAST|nr:hypothetical protein ElyMa_004933300 [Elysia marginata]